MTEYIDKAAKFAASAHAWEEEMGRVAGDLHPSTNIQNDFFGEIAFAVLVPRVVKAILPLLGERPDPLRFQHYKGAKELGLQVHDYRMIAPKNGKREKIHAPDGWIDEYRQRARIVYGAGTAEIDYGSDLLQRQDWRDRAHAMESMVTRGGDYPAVHVMPHVANLVYRAVQSTAQDEWGGSSLKSALGDYRRCLEDTGKEYTSDNIGYVSDRLALGLTSLSDELVREDISVWQSGRPFLRFDSRAMTDGDKLVYTGRAISQILTVTYLKAAEKRNVEAAALMSDVAYCGWAMTLLGDAQRYTDPELSKGDFLEYQWGLGLNTDPYALRTDKLYREEAYQKIVAQVPDLQPHRY